jgi:hypothetical protein
MKHDRKVYDALKEAGAVFIRHNNGGHQVFRLPCGRNIVLSHSPSDRNAGRQVLRELERIRRNHETL